MAQEVQAREPTEADLHLTAARWESFKWLVPAVWIAAVWIPLQAALPIVRALAGKNTHVDITLAFSLSIVVTLSVGGGFAAVLRRSRAQREEIVRLRRRISQLELASEASDH